MRRLMECFQPQDFMEQMLIVDLAIANWEMRRMKRHMTMAIEGKVRIHRKAQANRLNGIGAQQGQVGGDKKGRTSIRS